MPKGFQAAGAHVGIKRRRKDLALLWSDAPANVAAAFTTNVAKAAPIIWNQRVMNERKMMRGVAINSGNANACTGEDGLVHTEMMAETYAACKQVTPSEILIASTGVIGVPLPIDRIKEGIKATCSQLSSEAQAGRAAAEAILTTDSYVKEIALCVEIGGKTVTIGGMAKGSGMIHPNMATMLAFVTTDVNISPDLLDEALNKSIAETYNMISVDGDTSTNDMVAVLANGLAENGRIVEKDGDYERFFKALNQVNLYLAKAIVNDGEGATKFIEVMVKGTKTLEDAQKLSRSVVSSNLVKTALFGQEPNWGWILAAMGYGGVPFDPNRVTIKFQSNAGKASLVECGQPTSIDPAFASQVLKEREIQILIEVDEGECMATAWGCDLSYEYVRINGANRS
jgi:glutamate N-acetyltransferase/amino-acid N-acetyltransferase